MDTEGWERYQTQIPLPLIKRKKLWRLGGLSLWPLKNQQNLFPTSSLYLLSNMMFFDLGHPKTSIFSQTKRWTDGVDDITNATSQLWRHYIQGWPWDSAIQRTTGSQTVSTGNASGWAIWRSSQKLLLIFPITYCSWTKTYTKWYVWYISH